MEVGLNFNENDLEEGHSETYSKLFRIFSFGKKIDKKMYHFYFAELSVTVMWLLHGDPQNWL